MKTFFIFCGLFLAYLLIHLTVAVAGIAHADEINWTKADEYEFLDRRDGSNDNCVEISKKSTVCLGDQTRRQGYERLDRRDTYNDNCVVITENGRKYAYCLDHCRINPNDCPLQ